MFDTYTQSINAHLDSIKPEDYDEENIAELSTLLQDYLRSFSDGLTTLLKKTGYTGNPDDCKAKSNYINDCIEKMRKGCHNDNLCPSSKTIKNWVTGSRVPDQRSRDSIYELCFALSASLDDVNWFFNHVYFYRCFDYHDIKEAVYYYCFKNKLTYPVAQTLIVEIDNYSLQTDTHDNFLIHTCMIKNSIDNCDTIEDLKKYFKENHHFFNGQRNQSAKKNLNDLLTNVCGQKGDREIVNRILATNDQYRKDSDKCGLVVQELLFTYEEPEIPLPPHSNSRTINSLIVENEIQQTLSLFELLKNVKLTSITLMLDIIYFGGDIDGNPHNNLNELQKCRNTAKNFPSEKVFSELQIDLDPNLTKLDYTKNYDAIRKCLILLKFYDFWCRDYLAIMQDFECIDNGYTTYIEETNNLLAESGYSELFPGNAYDRLFMYCSKCESPLFTFRDFIKLLIKREDDFQR